MMNKIAIAAAALLLSSPALAQTVGTPNGPTAIAPTAAGSTRQPPPVTGSVDAPRTTSSETTPQQQLPGEAKATTTTDIDKPAPDRPTPAVPGTRPKVHHPHVKGVANGASDEPGAPPPH